MSQDWLGKRNEYPYHHKLWHRKTSQVSPLADLFTKYTPG